VNAADLLIVAASWEVEAAAWRVRAVELEAAGRAELLAVALAGVDRCRANAARARGAAAMCAPLAKSGELASPRRAEVATK
jgi:hypothetical protein